MWTNPLLKMPIDEFLDKHFELLRAKLKNEALQGEWDDFAMRIQMCDVCPLYGNCTEGLKCHKVLQELISLNEKE